MYSSYKQHHYSSPPLESKQELSSPNWVIRWRALRLAALHLRALRHIWIFTQSTMCVRHSYSRDYIFGLKPSIISRIPSETSETSVSRSSTWIKKRKRAGWQAVLSCTSPSKMTVPSLVSTNIRSLFAKLPDLTYTLKSRIHSNTCVVCIQESWLNPDIEDSLVQMDGFESFRQDRMSSKKKTGGGVITYINHSWSSKSTAIFKFSLNGIECLTVQCFPRFSRHRSTLLTNLYIAPFCSQSVITTFFDSFVPFISPLLDDNLHLIVGDFNHASTYPLLSLNLSDLCHSPTRGNSVLDRVITNHPNLFSLKLKSPISTSDHCVLLVRPTVYSRTGHHSFTQTNQIRLRLRNFSPNNVALLNQSLTVAVSWFFTNSSLFHCVNLFTKTMNSIFDLCCPLEKLLVCNGRLASPSLKLLRRQKECAYKCRNNAEVKRLSLLINVEIKRLEMSFADRILKAKNGRSLWWGINLLCGKAKTTLDHTVDVNALNGAFIHSSNDAPLTYTSCIDSEVDEFNNEDIYKLLRSSKTSSAAGPDGLSPDLLKYGAGPLTEAMTFIVNKSMSTCTIPDCWRPVTVIPLPKNTKSNVLSKRYRPIALTSSALKLTEKAILSRLQSHMYVPPDPFQFAYKANRSTLDAVSSLIHFISKSLNNSVKSVRCVFLDYSSAFDSVPRSQLLSKLQSFNCPRQLLSWLANYFTKREQCTKVNNRISKPLVNNSGVLQGAVLSPYLFSTYINDLPVIAPANIFKYADDVALCQPVSVQSDLQTFLQNLSQIHQFSCQSGLTLNSAKCVECVFSLSRTPFPLDDAVINGNILNRMNSIKYLGVTIDSNLRWSSHIHCAVGKLRRLSFQIRKLRQFRTPQAVITNFVYQCVYPILLYCSPVVFPGLLKQDFKILRRGLSIISRVSSISMDDLIKKLVDQHITSCISFAHKILADPTHPLYNDLSSCRSHPSTRSQFRHIPSRINIYKNSPIPYLARVLTNTDRIASDLCSSLGA